jgi:hypothetical protein
MIDSMHDPISIFDAEIPSEFLRDTLRCLKNCYREAHKYCRLRYPWQVAHDHLAYRRRTEFEKEWPMVASKYSEMSSGFFPNAAKNCFHTRIDCNRIVMTCSFVDQKLKTVRRAIFRDTYARSIYNYLFEEMKPPSPSAEASLYAILMHDAAGKGQSDLCVAKIIFPDPAGEIVASINLVDRFPDVFMDEKSAAPEVVDSELPIEIIDIPQENRKTS